MWIILLFILRVTMVINLIQTYTNNQSINQSIKLTLTINQSINQTYTVPSLFSRIPTEYPK